MGRRFDDTEVGRVLNSLIVIRLYKDWIKNIEMYYVSIFIKETWLIEILEPCVGEPPKGKDFNHGSCNDSPDEVLFYTTRIN